MHIRSLRIEKGMKLQNLSELVGVDPTQLKRWERGLEMPGAKHISAIAKVLGVTEATLSKAQKSHVKDATPGEGYTTADAGSGDVIFRRKPVPPGSRCVIDLFCGAGGLSFGFEQSGSFVTSCGVDLLPDRVATFVANHDHAVGIAGDIRLLSMESLKNYAGKVDVIVGGPPCQGFSSIRPFRNLTEGDPRNSLVEHYVLIIDALQPKWFVFENVVGLLTHEGGQRLNAIVQGLTEAGYLVDWRVVNTATYGVPQTRERIVIVGNRLGIEFKWPMPTHKAEHKSMAGATDRVIRTDPIFAQNLPPAVTLIDAIGDLPPVHAGEEETEYGISNDPTPYQRMMRADNKELTMHKATNHSERMLEIIRHAGANINALPKGMVKSGFSSCYSRLDADRPSTTLTVNFVHPASNRCIHPYQHRALTPREGARIQSFPDAFVFRGSSAQIVKQIGNAVPPLLGKTLAEAIVASEESVGIAPRKRLAKSARVSTVAEA